MSDLEAIIKRSDPIKWVFYGDSITHGAVHTHGTRDYTQLFAERIRYEIGRRLDIVINTAISGNTTRDLLAQYDWRVGQFEPDVVFIMIGMNDCAADRALPLDEFRTRLDQLVSRLRQDSALPVLQTTCPIIPGTASDREAQFPHYMDAIREAAAAHDVPLVDHLAHWQRHSDPHFHWMANAFHPNGYGHRAFARVLFEAMGIFDERAATCRLFVP